MNTLDEKAVMGLAQDLQHNIRNYRKSGELHKEETDLKVAANKLVDEMVEGDNLYIKEKVTIEGQEFWSKIIKVKIEIIAIMGGESLLKKVHDQIEILDENEEEIAGRNLYCASVFSALSDGIGGWTN